MLQRFGGQCFLLVEEALTPQVALLGVVVRDLLGQVSPASMLLLWQRRGFTRAPCLYSVCRWVGWRTKDPLPHITARYALLLPFDVCFATYFLAGRYLSTR